MLSRRSAVALCLVPVLAACGGDDPAAPRSVSSPTAAPGSPARSDERAAVEAAVRAYFEGYNRAFETGRASELARGSTEDCPCRDVVAALAKALETGRVEGNRYTVDAVTIVGVDGDTAAAAAVIDSSTGRQVAQDGRVVRTLGAQVDATKRLVLRKQAGRWLVAEVG